MTKRNVYTVIARLLSLKKQTIFSMYEEIEEARLGGSDHYVDTRSYEADVLSESSPFKFLKLKP